MDHIGGMNIRKYQLFWLIRVPWELPELRGGFVGFSGDWCHPLEYIRVIPCQSILWLLISNMLYCQPYLGWLFPCLYVFRLETCWNHQTSMVPCVTLRYATQLPGKEKKVWGKSAPWHRKGGRQPWVLNSRPVLSSKKRHLSVDCTCKMFQNLNQTKNGDHQDS